MVGEQREQASERVVWDWEGLALIVLQQDAVRPFTMASKMYDPGRMVEQGSPQVIYPDREFLETRSNWSLWLARFNPSSISRTSLSRRRRAVSMGLDARKRIFRIISF